MPFKFSRLEISDLILIEPLIFPDDRGYFLESYKQSDFKENGITDAFIQVNQSYSASGVIRGLHYQLPPSAQGKLVKCLRGRIFDVAVDIRMKSPNFGKWIGVELSEQNKKMLFIPVGFAHGFYAMEEAEVMYQTTNEYDPETERGIIWRDLEIAIKWPEGPKLVSEKDKGYPVLREADLFE